MRKQIAVLLLLAGMASWCHAQKIPKEVQNIIKTYIKDSTAEDGFFNAKRWLHLDESLKLSDIKVGIPIEVYDLQYDILDTCADSIPIQALIKPSDYWYLPISAHGKYIYEVNISKENGVWHTGGLSECTPDNKWIKIRNAYPESSGINPIFIRDGKYSYLHFPQKGARNLFYIRPSIWVDTLSLISSKSIDTLDDCRKIIEYRKNEYKKQKPKRDEFFQKHPNIFRQNGNSGGGK